MWEVREGEREREGRARRRRGREGGTEMELESGDVERKQEAEDVWDRKQTGCKVGERWAGCWKRGGREREVEARRRNGVMEEGKSERGGNETPVVQMSGTVFGTFTP